MKKELFLLGLIRSTKTYGYQINELIDSHFNLIVNITRPTAYRLLSKMEKAGWVKHTEESFDNRPPRKVFAITTEGEHVFQSMLRDALSDFSLVENHSTISLAYIDQIPEKEAVALLMQRQQKIEGIRKHILESEKHQGEFAVMFENQIHHLNLELDWIKKHIAEIELMN